MRIIKKSKEINSLFNSFKKTGFVPTMGSLHKGHEYLIKKSVKENNVTFVSIFVNPKQFNNKMDLKKYPKNLKEDVKICRKCKVNYLFLPSFKEVYSWKVQSKKKTPKIKNIMEHKYRKGHFKGVIKVIERLSNIIPASKMYLGEKDFQQIKVITDYFNINKVKTKIVKCKTVRDKNGLALSSRNKLLKKENLKRAVNIVNFIKKIKLKNIHSNLKINIIRNYLKKNDVKFDYVQNINLKQFNISKNRTINTRIFFAFYLGTVRLIDNL